jgi:predicted GH43/DUF377 family glycosyl hydrolase
MSEFKLKRMNGPILTPRLENSWESRAVFNPGIVKDNQIVHMLYRAVERENYSTIGYAKLNLDAKLIERRSQPVIVQEFNVERRGCEDPRIVNLDQTYYIFYTGFDGANPSQSMNTRVMLAETKDFQHFKKRGMVGPDVQDKDAMIFPEKIQNKVAYIHRIIPNIQLAFLDDIENLINPEKDFWKYYLNNLNDHTILFREYEWETDKIGAGPPPIRTEAGWLLIYHGVDAQKVYRAGAVLLAEKDPSKIIARLPYPILEPETDYEKYGDVNMVVFPEGLVEVENELLVFYGAADKVIGCAAGKLKQLLDELWRNKVK